ncbi:hypothetical protein H4R35_003860 [Dimargaris xerosporica]|nr:hypothetical protein H4R35_003860 [Dimargaris xerosporica]
MKVALYGVVVLGTLGVLAQAHVLIDVPDTKFNMAKVDDANGHHYLVNFTREDKIYSPQVKLGLFFPRVAVDWVATRLTNVKVDVFIADNGDVMVAGKRLRSGVQDINIAVATIMSKQTAENTLLHREIDAVLEHMRIAKFQMTAKIVEVKLEGAESPALRRVILHQRIISEEGVELTQKDYVENILEILPNGQVHCHDPKEVVEGQPRWQIHNDNGAPMATMLTASESANEVTKHLQLAAAGHRPYASDARAETTTSALRSKFDHAVNYVGGVWSSMNPALRIGILSALASFAIVMLAVALPIVIYQYFFSARARGYRQASDDEDDSSADVAPPDYKSVVAQSAETTEDYETVKVHSVANEQ